MPAKRKLFITHAGELAHLLVRAVERDGLVAEFVRAYATRHGRRKLVTDPRRMHELERTIGREALLVATVEIRRVLPRAFASSDRGTLRPEEAALCDTFYAEFLVSLERAMEWPVAELAAEAASFRRDLEMYRQWSNRSEVPVSAGAGGAAESPFPDRCAILLDPAMMEQARRAASNFEGELARAGRRMLDRLGRRGVRAQAKRLSRKRPRARKPKAAIRRVRKPAQKAKKTSSQRRPSRAGSKRRSRR